MAESDDEGKDGKFWYQCMISPVADSSILPGMLEKFSRLKSGEPQLKFCVKTLQMLGASLDVNSERLKSNEKAQKYRSCGNNLFSSTGGIATVAEMYTRSIAYALPGSRELALAYANRSAVSFKAGNYEDCLIDIQRSLENDYPDKIRAKLYARSVRCLVALERPQIEIEKALDFTREASLKMDLKASGRDLVEKTLTDKNHMAPTASTMKKHHRMKPTVQDDSCNIRGATGIAIQYSKKYGRHIIATRDIRPGEIIAVIDTYAHARAPAKCYRECSHCTTGTTVGIPCDHCVNVIYCSTSCRQRAWKDYHEIECPILGTILDLEFPGSSILGIRVTLKALQEAGSVIQLKKMLKRIDSISDPRIRGFTDNVLDFTKYASIYTLISHAGKHDSRASYLMSLMSTFTIYYLATRTEIFGQKYNTDLQVFDKNPLVGFLGGLMRKNYEIVEISASAALGQDDAQVVPFTALLNHCCDSNAVTVGTNKCITFALQPIKAGEQIWDSYECLHYSRIPKAERQQLLKEHHFFTCHCAACLEDWPMLEDLPSAYEMPGVSPATRSMLSNLEKAVSEKYNLGLVNGDMLALKDELVQLIELLLEHARPCKEIIFYREKLEKMYGYCFDST